MTTSRFPLLRVVAASVLLVTAAQTAAHSAPERAVAFHGGTAYTAESFNLELVITEAQVKLFVRDRHNRPLAVEGGTARALVWGQDNTVELELIPGEDNALQAELQPGAVQRVVVTLNMPNYAPAKAWFSDLGGKGRN